MGRKLVVAVGATLAAGSLAAGSLGAATASAAPHTSPMPAKNLSVQQVPNVGLTVGSNGISGTFSASIAAAATTPGVTQISLRPMPAKACAGNLRDTRVAITLRNEKTGATKSAVFPSCTDGKAAAGREITTGTGRISFTTTILGRGQQTFTVVPGSGSFTR